MTLDKKNINSERNQIIDFLRGITILDMVFVHFNKFFPVPIQKFLSYTDFAMESFVFLFGFMVGSRYYSVFLATKVRATKRLYRRVVQIFLIQGFFILTINVPMYYLYDNIRQKEPICLFLAKSVLFLNQIGLIHILPTFIPLLLISPIMLFFFSKGMHYFVLSVSILLFIIGNKFPYCLDLGDKTIFPFILWQIYFVIGSVMGVKISIYWDFSRYYLKQFFFLSLIILFLALIVKHSKIIAPTLTSKFPLNALGFYYGASFLLVLYLSVIRYWGSIISRIVKMKEAISSLGRHSLAVFVLHVYLAMVIYTINNYYQICFFVNWIIIAACFYLMVLFANFLDKKMKESISEKFSK